MIPLSIKEITSEAESSLLQTAETEKDQKCINDFLTRVFHVRQAMKWTTLHILIYGSVDLCLLLSNKITFITPLQ
jgi:hypothetical protein